MASPRQGSADPAVEDWGNPCGDWQDPVEYGQDRQARWGSAKRVQGWQNPGEDRRNHGLDLRDPGKDWPCIGKDWAGPCEDWQTR